MLPVESVPGTNPLLGALNISPTPLMSAFLIIILALLFLISPVAIRVLPIYFPPVIVNSPTF